MILAIKLLLALAVYNALVQALPKPTEKSGEGYRYAYRAAHLLAMNFRYAFKARFPDYAPFIDGDDQPSKQQ
jgi:hypothetical protein